MCETYTMSTISTLSAMAKRGRETCFEETVTNETTK